MPASDTDSAADLNRLQLIGVCNRILRQIREHNEAERAKAVERRERTIQGYMKEPRRSLFGVPRDPLTREQAVARYSEELNFRGWETYSGQRVTVESLLALAMASEADVVRVTKGDFRNIADFWPKP